MELANYLSYSELIEWLDLGRSTYRPWLDDRTRGVLSVYAHCGLGSPPAQSHCTAPDRVVFNLWFWREHADF